MKKYPLFLLICCFAACYANCQEISDKPETTKYALTQKKYTFAVQPLQFFNRALRLDFEMRLGDGPGWLQFGPAAYYINRDINEEQYPRYYYDGNDYFFPYDEYYYFFSFREPFSKVTGAGLDVNYKRFVDPQRSFYFAGGLSFTRFKIDYWGLQWKNYIEDGVQYYTCTTGLNSKTIDRLGINAFLGYQIPYPSLSLFDIFWGFAYRTPISNKGTPKFSDNMFSFGYSGMVVMTGFRVGFGIR